MSSAGYARKEQTQQELQQLDNDLQTWLAYRRARDGQQQYRTQLQAIAALVGNTIHGLEHELVSVAVDDDDVYTRCRLFDLRTLWLRRVWLFFKEKFDQRDDPGTGPLLRAADEVVWSCYRQVSAGLSNVQTSQLRPVPIPFIEASYSPRAFPSSLLSTQFNDSKLGGSFLHDRLNGLTLSVVRLSPACVRAPWWLVYLGHEMGHHIQHDAGLVEAFRLQVESVVRTQRSNEQEISDWGDWSEEIFADLVSLHLMGQWALRAMIELERTSPEQMQTRGISYPAPYVRLHLMAEAANSLGLPGTTMLDAAALPVEQARVAHDLAVATRVAHVVECPLPGLSVSLRHLVGFRREEFLPTGSVAQQAKKFLPSQIPAIERTLRAARLCSCASLAAWAETLTAGSREQGAVQRQHLARVAPGIIAESREAGTRSGTRAGEASFAPGLSLTDLLMQASSEQLECEDRKL
jgi:hypothetical protein